MVVVHTSIWCSLWWTALPKSFACSTFRAVLGEGQPLIKSASIERVYLATASSSSLSCEIFTATSGNRAPIFELAANGFEITP